MLAKDSATRKAWRADPLFSDWQMSSKRKGDVENLSSDDIHNDWESYYMSDAFRSEPYAYYHRAVSVKGIHPRSGH